MWGSDKVLAAGGVRVSPASLVVPQGPHVSISPVTYGTQGVSVPAETHVEQPPLDRSAISQLIRDRLAEILEIEADSINETDSFADDLEADSLALIELVEALEEELAERSVGFRIEDEDLEDMATVRDAVDYVLAKVG